ncbi:SPOR domain-containing protein [Luteimonas terrae]|uniref:Cell division septation protein DedD n=1 Tax=Luteimonas terrae TaxID=1530191 RepID=A0ABU1XZL3_9GAMM|nr:SPOR domain-containing protein [Luteimonas terrae]MDR7194217.1 cell division septation protein DedD [Luteimonas terrae]
MLLRATVVLLVILNFGAAAWWALRGEPGDAAALVDPGPSTLQLVGEASAEDGATPAGAEPAANVSDAALASAGVDDVDEDAGAGIAMRAAEPAQCVTLGPFADAETRDAALAQLSPTVVRATARDVGETPRGWRVWMAPLADRAAADAMVVRLLASGFNDYYVIADGAEAHGIALGRFGSEASARARAQALRAAGFEAEAAPLGSTLTRHWIDVTLAEGDTGEALRSRIGAARVETRDCNAQRVAG